MRLGRTALALTAAAALTACRCCTCEATGPPGPLGGAGPGPPSSSPPKLTIQEDPLDLGGLPSDYRNWASVVARVLLTKAGGDAGAATDALGRLMLTTHGLLARASDGGEDLFPRLHLADTVFARDAASARPGFSSFLDALDGKSALKAKVKAGAAAMRRAAETTPTYVTGKIVTHNFIEFTPCVLSETPVGAWGEMTGLNFVPNLINISPVGFTAYFQGVNIQPALIFIQPVGANLNPELFNFQPGLLYIGPIGVNVQPQGLDVSPIGLEINPMGYNHQAQGLSVEPTRFLYEPSKVCYNPIKHLVDETVRVDLYRLQTTGNATATENSDGCRRRLLRRLQ